MSRLNFLFALCYTYNVYLKCRRCKRVYRPGVCSRGAPIYEVLDARPDKMNFGVSVYEITKSFMMGGIHELYAGESKRPSRGDGRT